MKLTFVIFLALLAFSYARFTQESVKNLSFEQYDSKLMKKMYHKLVKMSATLRRLKNGVRKLKKRHRVLITDNK